MAGLRSSFASRLLAAVIVLVLLPTAVLGFYFYSRARTSAMDTELARIGTASSELADRIDALIVDERDLARFAASTTEVRDFVNGPRDVKSAADLITWLEDSPYFTDDVSEVFVLDAQGTCIASTDSTFVGQSYGIRPYFQDSVGGADAVSDWSIGMTSGTAGIYLSSPVRGEYGEVAGVLVVKLRTDQVDDLFQQAFDVGTRAVLLNEAGVILTGYEDGYRYRTVDDLTAPEAAQIRSTQQFADEPLESLGLTGLREDLTAVAPGDTSVSREYVIDGEGRVAALTGLVTRPWIVAVVAPLATVESAAAQVPLIVGALLLLVLLYAGVASIYLGRFVIRPLHDLVDSSHDLAAGDLTVQVPVRGDDEVSQLARAFNTMAVEIRGNTERLETEVARRTAELEDANRAITQLSITDALTGCFNRLYLDRQLDYEIEHANRYQRDLSVILCDIDLFKDVNDEFGHEAGDNVLREIGRVLQAIRRGSDWTARFGGEEFVIVLPETGIASALAFAERIRAALAAAAVDGPGEPISITGSFGVASRRPTGADTAQTLLSRADAALYRAKAAGRNRVAAESPPDA